MQQLQVQGILQGWVRLEPSLVPRILREHGQKFPPLQRADRLQLPQLHRHVHAIYAREVLRHWMGTYVPLGKRSI